MKFVSAVSISLVFPFFKKKPQNILVAGVQASVSCKDSGVGTSSAAPFWFSSTQLKRPPKRARMDIKEELEEDDPLIDAFI